MDLVTTSFWMTPNFIYFLIKLIDEIKQKQLLTQVQYFEILKFGVMPPTPNSRITNYCPTYKMIPYHEVSFCPK